MKGNSDRQKFISVSGTVLNLVGSILLLGQQRRTLSRFPEQGVEEEEEERGYWEFGSNKDGLTRVGQMDGWQATLDKRNRQVPN